MIHVELTFIYQYFNLHTLSHVSLQGIFFDMVDVDHPDFQGEMPQMPRMPENNVFPRLPHVLNDHMAWAKGFMEYGDIPVSATNLQPMFCPTT
jgi:hypothetical protein